jgi:hypothetical protein
LLAALAALINDIEPIRSSPDTQETNQTQQPLLKLAGKVLTDVNPMTGIHEVRQSMRPE